ncbi:MAG TPA: suppressor of fused domain protein [Pirellulaceae bacterium]|nr:suppressor of fused domain protein [Pirellulaceae bacterium]
MSELTPFQIMWRMLGKVPIEEFDKRLRQFPELFNNHIDIQEWLADVAGLDLLDWVKYFVSVGGDIHEPMGGGSPPSKEGVIVYAAREGAINVVRWLLEQGVTLNFEYEGYPGERRCFALTGACLLGHLEVVKLLVEHGADVNALWYNLTPLSHALMGGHREIEAYLRSVGGKLPEELGVTTSTAAPSSCNQHEELVLAHIRRHFGKPRRLSLMPLVASDMPVKLVSVSKWTGQYLFTVGMSNRKMNVPLGKEAYQFAELMMALPRSWPLNNKSLQDPRKAWPIEWMLRIAHFPFEHNTWLGGPSTVIDNGEHREPLCPGLKFTSWLAITEESKEGWLRTPTGGMIGFFSLYPLYPEERDLERQLGTEALIHRFMERGIPDKLDVNRANVGID